MRASPALLGPFRRQIVMLTACVTALAMLLLTLVLQLILSGLSRGHRRMGGRSGPPTGGPACRDRRGLERARPGPALRPRPPGQRDHRARRDLDTLLDKVAAAIRSEQRLTSELAHELRTPLTTLLEMARTAPAVPEIAGMTSCSLAEAVRDALAASGPQGAEVSTDVADHRLAMPVEVALRALAPVVRLPQV